MSKVKFKGRKKGGLKSTKQKKQEESIDIFEKINEIEVAPPHTWKTQKGTQAMFLHCPIFEVLLAGTRGNGKTDSLLMDFAQHIGLGPAWRGILFRRTYKQLTDITAKTKKFFPKMFPGVRFNSTEMVWKWPTGEELLLRYIKSPNDYWNYHGHEYPWIGWEELTSWPTDECYESMKSCCRSSDPTVPRKYRATTNPYGPGHSWVKAKFVDPAPAGTIITSDSGMKRIRLQGHIRENRILMESDPYYVAKLKDITDPNKKKAWLEGDWDIVAGGAISDLWDNSIHNIRPFKIPSNWKIDRSFDWGSSSPFSVGFWAEADGTMAVDSYGNRITFPKGTLFRINELYGWSGRPNDGLRLPPRRIAEKILSKQKAMGLKIEPGPADPSIWDSSRGSSIADMMKGWKQNGNYVKGVDFARGDNSPGSRINGLEVFRDMLDNSLDIRRGHPMQGPGFFVFGDNCKNFMRTVPTIPRDEENMDDVDTSTEDHCFHGDTSVNTSEGQFKIKDLVGKTGMVKTINGGFTDFYDCRKTRDDAILLRLMFDNGSIVLCTMDHKFLHMSRQFMDARFLKDQWVLTDKNEVTMCVKIDSVGGRHDVFCLTADNTHCFSIESGLIVHNCYDETRYRILRSSPKISFHSMYG